MFSNRILWVAVLIATVPIVRAVAQGLDTASIDQALGRPGQKTGDVYRCWISAY